MGTVHIGPEEQQQMIDSQERSLELVRRIYVEVALWRMHGLESHQKKAHSLKKELDTVLEDVMPFHIVNTNSFSPPAQKRRKVPYGGSRSRRKL